MIDEAIQSDTVAAMPGRRAQPPAKGLATPKGRSAVGGKTAATMMRLDPALMAELDAWVDRLNENEMGPRWTRSDLIRVVLTRAVRERGQKGEPP